MFNKVQIISKDGVKLAGILLKPVHPKAVIQINSATAVLKEFYSSFALYLMENHFAVLYYDYYGIGESKPESGLKDVNFKYTDWAKKDMASGIDFCKKEFPNFPLLILGHSVGGQMIGLVPNTNGNVKGMVTVNTSSGYGGNMKLKNRLRNFYFFEIIRPISLALFGYGKLKKLGIMEDIPKNIYNDWREWCSVSDYFFDKKYSSSIEGIEGFQNINFPVEVFTATDDDIATEKNLRAFWKHVKSTAGINFHWLNPKDFGLKEIGHFSLFRKKHKETLWPVILNKLEQFIK